MGKGGDKNYVSVWFWLLAMLVLAIPCVNLVMIIIWAFVGQNESRKNYFKAMIWVFVISVCVSLLIMLLGMGPLISQLIQNGLHDLGANPPPPARPHP